MLGAFAGLGSSEVRGRRTAGVDFMRGTVSPRVQFGGAHLESESSVGDIPIPLAPSSELAAHSWRWADREGEFLLDE